MVFPEVYLEDGDAAGRVASINKSMQENLDNGTLVSLGEAFVLLERSLANGAKRSGLMVSLDLEAYDFRKGSQTLIRATEGTIVDRLPSSYRDRLFGLAKWKWLGLILSSALAAGLLYLTFIVHGR